MEIACSCGKSFRVPDQLAGKRVKCPACQQPVAVPSPADTAAPASTAIRVACECGNRLSVKQQLAGKAVKCPECGKPVRIPAEPSESAATAGEISAGKTQPSENDGVERLLDEVDLKASATGRRCPDCRKDMEPDDVICVNCGFNTETGRKLGTRRAGRKEEGKPIGRFRAKSRGSGKQAVLVKVVGLLLLVGVAVYLALRTAGIAP
jgi:hypothetical protein